MKLYRAQRAYCVTGCRFLLTTAKFIKVTEVCHENASRKSVTKLPQKSMLRELAKASEAKIWTRVRRRYLTSFAGFHFENEPGLTELDAAEGGEIDCPDGFDDLNLQIYPGLRLVDKRPTLASIATKE